MSDSSDDYTLEDAKDEVGILRRVTDDVVEAIQSAENEKVLEFLIEEEKLDVIHDGERGLGQVRRAVLVSPLASDRLKRIVSLRGDETPEEILVPNDVERNAKVALETGKPVVLYGPTGTGKTTFAKQLARETGIGYTLNTATPSWTPSDIIGGISPDYTGDSLSYRTKLGCVSEAVQRARRFDVEYGVILDEITRADISKIFGPLYTAIENPHQTIFETDEGETIELDERVNIICTMNMSDRTVNELDNAITRRFAMIELDEYEEDKRRQLFKDWITTHVPTTPTSEKARFSGYSSVTTRVSITATNRRRKGRSCGSVRCTTATSPSSSASAAGKGESTSTTRPMRSDRRSGPTSSRGS
nr:AAA family ATPase [Haloarchaeobius sp. FL176]